MAPATVHYDAVERIFKYLQGTCDHGIIYWHCPSLNALPLVPSPPLLSLPDNSRHWPKVEYNHSYSYIDSDWALDIKHRHSISGMAFLLHGGIIAWRSQV